MPQNMRATVLCSAIKNGGQTEFEFVFKLLKEGGQLKSDLKLDLLIGLSCTKEVWLLDKFLNDRLDHSNDILIDLENAITKTSSYLVVWNFIKSRWNEIYGRY